MKKITVVIPRKGMAEGKSGPRTSTEGFVGETCRNATRALEKMMGSVVSDVDTHENLEPPMDEQVHLTE